MTRMFRRIIRHEWRNLAADHTAWPVMALFALVIGYAFFNGRVWLKHQRQDIERMLQGEQKGLAELRGRVEADERKAAAEGKLGEYPRFGPRNPLYVSIPRDYNYAILPPTPLAPMAVGQSDLYPAYYKVTAGMKESFMTPRQTESPFKLLGGQFDLAFVILYLYPLLILALGFNLVASEKEEGTLAMLLANRVRLNQIVMGKVCVRALVIFFSAVVFSVIGLALSGTGLIAKEALMRLLLWVLAVTAYGAFWFALTIAVNALGRNAAANAIALAACWLAFAVMIPSAVNLAASAYYPIPSRVEFVNARRVEEREAMERGSQLLAKFVEDHPEFAPTDASLDTADFGMLRMARDEEVSRKLKPVLDRFNAQIARQGVFVSRLRYLSPALLMQEALYDVAGTGGARYQHFRAQVDAHYNAWKDFFAPRIFQKSPITLGDFDHFPRFKYQEELAGALIKRVVRPTLLLLTAAAMILLFGLRRYGVYPVVGQRKGKCRKGK